MTRRYPGAQPFSTDQKPIFFGREQELDELHRFMLAEQLVVLYAKSGLGKSSLLNAGLMPLVQEEGRLEPLSIRFGAYTEGSKATPLGNAIAGIREGISGTDENLEKIKPAGEDSLWYHLKTRQLAAGGRGYLLVFDQFEELFTYPEEAVQAFGKQLSELLYTTIPDRFRQQLRAGVKANAAFLPEAGMQRLHRPFELRVIMAIRSDRMSLMNKLKAFLPNILENCYELRSLTIQEAESAILSPAYLPMERGPFESPVFDYEDEAVASLVDFLSEGRTQEIESFQLQILCEHAERQVVLKQGKTLVTRSDVANPDLILENYYLGKIEDLPESDRLPARRLIEEGLVFEEEERRLTLYEGQITRTYGIGPALLRTLLDTHLIRSEPSLRGGYTYELSHDTLVAPVLKAKNKRLEAERLEAEREALRRKEEEMAALREKAEKEMRLREKAEVNEKQARQRTRLAAFISIVALALALFAGWSYLQAQKARESADLSAKEALKQKAEADAARIIADSNATVALQKTKEAEDALTLADKNLKIAKAEEARATAALEQVKKEKAATEEQRKIAENNARIAQEKREEAESLREQAEFALDRATQEKNRADEERDKAQTALDNLEKSNTEVVKLILKNAERDVLNLRYEDALEKIKAAASLGALKPEVTKAWLEIAFWHAETGDSLRATALMDSIGEFAGIKISHAKPLRENMQVIDVDHFDSLFNKKYYPEMVKVEGGTFWMGCDKNIDPNCESNETLHQQEVSPFWMAKYETTVWQFALFGAAMGIDIKYGYLVSTWTNPGDNPVVRVRWYDAVAYANWVSRQKGYSEVIAQDDSGNIKIDPASKGYRLPTEAEWEYAAKGGRPGMNNVTIYSGSNSLDSVGWIYENRTLPVGQKKPNPLGLYDMSGNVWEWCWDWYGSYPGSLEKKDYAGPGNRGLRGIRRVIRGGSLGSGDANCRISNRNSSLPHRSYDDCGFRLSRAL
ncbi:MAG: SUMF1/EgtB/PvdO family nonheme iron enzyme [Saprospiraceae bacterium]